MACPLRQRLPAPLQGHSLPHPHHAPPVPQTAARAEPCRRHRRFQSPCRHGHAAWVEDPPERVWGALLASPNLCTVYTGMHPADAIAWRVAQNSTPAQGGPAIDGAPIHAGAPAPRLSPLYGLARHTRPVSRPLLSSRSLERVHHSQFVSAPRSVACPPPLPSSASLRQRIGGVSIIAHRHLSPVLGVRASIPHPAVVGGSSSSRIGSSSSSIGVAIACRTCAATV